MRASVEAAAGAGTVRWGGGPHTFELRSTVTDVISRAALVFRPWQVATTSVPTRVWALERDGDPTREWTLSMDGAPVSAVPSDTNRVIRRVEYLAVQAIFDGPPDVVTAHAALVARDGLGVLIAGIPESGKSTLACAMWQRGFTLVGDDVAMIDLTQHSAAPAPRRVSLRAPSRALLGEALWRRIQSAPASEPTDEGWVFHPEEIGGPRPAAVRVVATVFLGRSHSADSRNLLRPLPPAHAALALLPCLNVARRLDVGTLVAQLTPWATAVPGYDLGRADLATMSAAVERLLD